MTRRPVARRGGSRLTRAAALAGAVLVLAGCYGSDDHYCCAGPPYEPYPTSCEPGIDQADIDRGAIRELDAGEGVGATIEYAGDGAWRVAATCDLAVNPSAGGVPCEWVIVIGALDGDIHEFTPEALEPADVIEWYPGTQGSLEEDAIRLESLTDYDVDAFTFRTDPGAGIWVSAALDGACGAPYLLWLDDGRDATTTAEMIELIPDVP